MAEEYLQVVVALRDVSRQGGGRSLNVWAEEDGVGARRDLTVKHGSVERPSSQPDGGNVVTEIRKKYTIRISKFLLSGFGSVVSTSALNTADPSWNPTCIFPLK